MPSNYQRDAALHLEAFFPVSGGNVQVNALDVSVSLTGFSSTWAHGYLRVSWPALPNNTDPTKVITISLQDSADNGATFQSGAAIYAGGVQPVIQVQIPGVAGTGSDAGFANLPLCPDGRGPIGLQASVPAGVGDCSQAMFTGDWYS
jgi:hypothetical protein